jgi:hypothetical protein
MGNLEGSKALICLTSDPQRLYGPSSRYEGCALQFQSAKQLCIRSYDNGG